MHLCHRLAESFQARAEAVEVRRLSIGLGYTAVETSDKGIGLAFTSISPGPGCSQLNLDRDLEDVPAADLLRLLGSSQPLHRSLGLATLNALNHAFAMALPEDRKNETLLRILEVEAGTRLGMVGFIGPLLAKLQEAGAAVEVVDQDRDIGNANRFAGLLRDWAEVLIMSSTAILNDTVEPLLAKANPEIRCALIGPSTPLLAEPFEGLPVRVLAGTAPVNAEATFRAVRHGRGTPVLQRFARKPYLQLGAEKPFPA